MIPARALLLLALAVPVRAARPLKERRREIARLMENHEWVRARAALDAALTAAPRDVGFELDRAAVADELGEEALARRLLAEVLAAHPGIAARRRAAEIFDELGDAARAAAERDALLRDAPGCEGVRLDRAEADLEWSRPTEAERELDAAEDLVATFDERRERAALYARAGKPGKARADLEALSRDYPDRPEPRLDLQALAGR